MTSSSHTLLIEPNRLFRQGLKHLLADTCFDVGAEFNCYSACNIDPLRGVIGFQS